ncbi:MAG: 50S ribosomal protein LX [Methanomassiliicoccales archaeon]|nr:50S ribosomal protein LX [Methanomassiliicoccales archaeon]NYT15215.1 50S ribosomal protein LX [Methanomassiliicoccales archaeon]
MKAFRVIGSFKIDKRKWQDFKLEVAAEDVEGATDKVLSTLGSRHRLNRKEIQIKDIVEISGEDISDLTVKYLVEEKG